MNEGSVKRKTISGLFWRFLERTGAQGVNFIVSVILARLLAPNLYGTIMLITVFTSILQIFVDSGMGDALIQKKNADDVDFSSVFYFNMVMCSLLYIGMFIAAPYIATFYDDPTLTPVIRVMSLTLVISGLKNVQQAYISKHLLFKKFFFATLGGTITSAIIGITMAFMGFGVWALVAQDLSNKLIDTIVLWFSVKWRPKLLFSLKRLKSLISYGWKLLCALLLDSIYNNIRQLIIGKVFSKSELAYYNKGNQFSIFIVNNMDIAINSVLFPAVSSQQDKIGKVKTMTRRSITLSAYVIWPLMMTLFFIAEPLIRILLTDKWIMCVPYLRIFCITYALYPIITVKLNAIKSLGRSDISLKIEIIKKVIGFSVMFFSIQYGALAMAYSLLFTTVVNLIITMYPNKKLFQYRYIEQIKDLVPTIILAGLSGCVAILIGMIHIHIYVSIVLQTAGILTVYLLASKLLKLESYQYLMKMVTLGIKKIRKQEQN